MKITISRRRGSFPEFTSEEVPQEPFYLKKVSDLLVPPATVGYDRNNQLSGIFTRAQYGVFYLGDIRKEFFFPGVDWLSAPLAEIAQEIRSRVQMVRGWVDSLPIQESLEMFI